MGAKDRDDDALRELTCLIKNKNDTNYQNSTLCIAKRSTIMIRVDKNLESDSTNPVQLDIVGITNPDTSEAVTVKLWVMDYGSTTNQDEHVKEAFTTSATFAGKP